MSFTRKGAGRAAIVGAALVLAVAACKPGHGPPRPPKPGASFLSQAQYVQRTAPDTRPWFCNAVGNGTPPNGHGNGGHVHPYYEGKQKGPLSWPDCLTFAGELDQTMDAVKGLETKGKAEAAGWREAAPYIPGLGTHHVRAGTGGGMPSGEEAQRIRQCLIDKGIDLSSGTPNITDPGFIEALEACGVNLGAIGGGGTTPAFGAFDPAKPPLLIYGGDADDAPLVGVGYMFAGGDTPPEAYTGGNDWWHLHTKACFGLPPDLQNTVDPEHLTDEECERLGGTMRQLFPGSGGIWLLHFWPVLPYEYRPDLFVSGHPCLGPTGVLPQSDPCWRDAKRDPAKVPPPGPTTTTKATPTTGSPSTSPPTTAGPPPSTAVPTTPAPPTTHGDHGH